MLEQTKRTVDNLLSSGLQRKEFRVRVNRNRYGEYTGLNIYLLCPVSRAIELSKKIAECFEVIHLIINGRVSHVSVYEGRPGIKEWNCDKKGAQDETCLSSST